jgi:hypothetical protein
MRIYDGWGASAFRAGVTIELDDLRQNNSDLSLYNCRANIIDLAYPDGRVFNDTGLNVTDIGGVEVGQMIVSHGDEVRPSKASYRVEARLDGTVRLYFCTEGLSDLPTVVYDLELSSSGEGTDTATVLIAGDLGLGEGDEFRLIVFVEHTTTLYRLLVVEDN